MDAAELSKFLPRFSWEKYPGEKHFPSYNYLGPNTRLDLRLDENDQPKQGELPISPTDNEAYKHDLKYRDSSNLEDRHKADREMISALENIKTTGLSEKLANLVSRKILQLKLKLGVGLEEEEIAKELHTQVRTGQKRMVLVLNQDEVWSCDLAEMEPAIGKNHIKYKFLLVCIDVFTRYAWLEPIRNKNVQWLISAYKKLFTEAKPRKIWFDKEKAIYSKEMKKFLDDNNIELYSTENEGKSVIAERFIRTMRESLAKIKTEAELTKSADKGRLSGNWIKELPNILMFYNNHFHRGIAMSPNEARKSENHRIVRETLFKRFHQIPVIEPKFKVNDPVRIFKYRNIFTKVSSEPNFTTEIFYIDKIHNTRPITYSIKDKEGEVIKGSFYQFELLPSNTTV